jgi:outer membrane protein TolC
VVATWDFFEGGKTRYTVREKESLQQELFQTRQALEDDIRLQVKDSVLALIATEENIPTQRKAVEQGEENLRVNEERYKAQVTTINEVLLANPLLARARSNYYQTLYNHVLAKARLDRSLGTY